MLPSGNTAEISERDIIRTGGKSTATITARKEGSDFRA
jgi:hypothetical protein